MKRIIFPTILFSISLVIIGLKHTDLQISEYLRTYLTLENVNLGIINELKYVLLIPIGGVVVVFIRQTLGIRMLGPFRPLLIALGFQGSGIFVGLIFFIFVSLVLFLIRPRLRAQKIPYSSRLTILLCVIVMIEFLMIFFDRAFDLPFLGNTVYFPIVVLCLAAEGLGKLAAEKGKIVAIWRGANTLAVAVIVYFIFNLSGFMMFQIKYPEILFGIVGLIILVGKNLNFQVLGNFDMKITNVSLKSVEINSSDSNSEYNSINSEFDKDNHTNINKKEYG